MKVDNAKLQSIDLYSWRRALQLVCKLFTRFCFKFTLRSIKLSGFRCSNSILFEDILKEDEEAAVQDVVDQFGEAEGFQFQFHYSRPISKRARSAQRKVRPVTHLSNGFLE